MVRSVSQFLVKSSDIEWQAVRAQGAGGQNVNKVSTAVHLRFNIHAATLPEQCKQKLLALRDQRINKDGIIVIKAQKFRSQDKNRDDAIARLQHLIDGAMVSRKARKATKPSRNSQKKRMDSKTRRGRIKSMRGSISDD